MMLALLMGMYASLILGDFFFFFLYSFKIYFVSNSNRFEMYGRRNFVMKNCVTDFSYE